MLGIRLVMGNEVLSLRSGGGNTPTRGLNEVRRKINSGALRNTDIQWRERMVNTQTCMKILYWVL